MSAAKVPVPNPVLFRPAWILSLFQLSATISTVTSRQEIYNCSYQWQSWFFDLITAQSVPGRNTLILHKTKGGASQTGFYNRSDLTPIYSLHVAPTKHYQTKKTERDLKDPKRFPRQTYTRLKNVWFSDLRPKQQQFPKSRCILRGPVKPQQVMEIFAFPRSVSSCEVAANRHICIL